MYDRWSAGPASAGRRALRLEDQPTLISWTGTADRLDAVLAGPDYIRSIWAQALRGQPVLGGLTDVDRQLALGSVGKDGQRAVRTTDVTGLPWTLCVTSADPVADSAFIAWRRRLLLSGFVVIALVLAAGSYFITRSIARELAVTRLQSEFVSAVSHEFRTPLTSIRPDGKIAFAAVGQGKNASIRALDVASGQARVITGTGAYVPSLAASPDGRQIAYLEAADDANGTVLWLVNVDGGVPQRIATLPFATPGTGLAWTPDGRYVLMADYDRTGKRSGVRRVSVADGTFVSSGVALDGMLNGLSMSPDGRQLAVEGGVAKTESWVLENFLPKPAAAPGVKVK